MSQLTDQIKKHEQHVASELHKTRKFMSTYRSLRKNQGVMASFDSLQDQETVMPDAMMKLMSAKGMSDKKGTEALLDGLSRASRPTKPVTVVMSRLPPSSCQHWMLRSIPALSIPPIHKQKPS